MNRHLLLTTLVAFAALAAPAIVAAAEPALTTTVIPGQEIDVTGTGFPGDADVLLVIERNGTDADSRTLHTDAAGSFTARIDAGPGRGGTYTLVATSGAAKAVAEALAVETAGAGGTGGLRPTPPPTDAASSLPARSAPAHGWAVALVGLLGLSFGLWYVARSARGRRIGDR